MISNLLSGGLSVMSGLTQPTVTEVENLSLSVGAAVPQTGGSLTSFTFTVNERVVFSSSGSVAVTVSACEVALSWDSVVPAVTNRLPLLEPLVTNSNRSESSPDNA